MHGSASSRNRVKIPYIPGTYVALDFFTIDREQTVHKCIVRAPLLHGLALGCCELADCESATIVFIAWLGIMAGCVRKFTVILRSGI